MQTCQALGVHQITPVSRPCCTLHPVNEAEMGAIAGDAGITAALPPASPSESWTRYETYRWLAPMPRLSWGWEWLRRNPEYRADYVEAGSSPSGEQSSLSTRRRDPAHWSLVRLRRHGQRHTQCRCYVAACGLSARFAARRDDAALPARSHGPLTCSSAMPGRHSSPRAC